MNFIKNIILFLIVFILQISFCRASSSEIDTVKQYNSISTKKIMLLNTIWSQSKNATSLTYFNYDEKIGTAFLYSEFQDKNYHLFQEGNKNIITGFYTDGYLKYRKWNFYGSFNYFTQQNKNIKWVSVMNPYNDNPYSIGDSIGGNYSKEYFNMEGKGSYKLNEKLSFGFDVKYLTGVGAKKKDPRPENTITTFNISPGIIVDFDKVKIGANFRYEGSKEDIKIYTVTQNNYNIFHFKGLGVFSSTSEFDDRIIVSDLLGGGFQFNFSGNQLNNLTEINFHKKSTDIKQGTTYPLQVVLLEKFNTEIVSTFILSPKKKDIKRLKLFYNNKRLYGHEPVVEPKLETVNYQWSTAAKYTLYWHKENEYGFNYSYFKIIDNNHFNWGATLFGKINSSKTTYYFVPEYNKQKLNYFNINATFEKGFQYKSGNIVISCNSGYRKGFNSDLEIIEEESLLSTVNTEFITHDFEFYNSGLLQFGVSAKIGKNISFYKNTMQIFFDAGLKTLISEMTGNPKTIILEVKLGMNF